MLPHSGYYYPEGHTKAYVAGNVAAFPMYAESDDAISTEYQLRPIDDVIDSIITDPLLAKVLVGNLPLYAAEKGKTPFSAHAFIMDFYNQSAYRVVGGVAMPLPRR